MDSAVLHRAVELAGTPVWVFDLDRVADNASALKARAGDASISYAIKANDHPAVLKAAKKGGISAEAASGREYALAREAGFGGNQIVFNGPFKTDEELRRAFDDGALVNADSLDEVARITRLAPKGSRAGIRIQSNLIEGAVGDRFGLTAEEALRAAHLLRDAHIGLAQLHAHLGSYTVHEAEGPTSKRVDLIWPRSPDLTAGLAARLIGVARELAAIGLEPETISLGGGLPTGATAGDHIEAARKELAASGLSSQLSFEPGRAVISDAASLVCRVVQVRAPDRRGRRQIVVDAGVNLLPTVEWRDADLVSLDGKAGDAPSVVFGPLCLQSDVLAWNAMLPELQAGDLLVARNVGAYNWVRSTSFIFPTAPLVLYEQGELLIDEARK